MLPFLGPAQKPKRTRSHRNTVWTQRVLIAIFSGCSCVERDVGLLGSPEAVEQDSKLSSYSNNGLVLGLLAPARCQMQSPLSQC